MAEFFTFAEAEEKVGKTVVAAGTHFLVPKGTRGRVISFRPAGDTLQFMVLIQWEEFPDAAEPMSKDDYHQFVTPVGTDTKT